MTKLVLIVEDEAIIRMNAVAIVEDAGFDVVEASNADDAMALMDPARTSRLSSPTSTCPDP